MKVIDKINSVVSKILVVCMVVLLVFMTVLYAYQVIGRYVFNTGFTWSEEITRYSMIWVALLGAGWIVINSEHIKITAIEDMMHGKSKKVLNIIHDLVSLAFVVAIFIISFDQIKIASMGVSQNSGINNAVQYMIFPVSMAVSAWGYITRLIKRVAYFNRPDEEVSKEGDEEVAPAEQEGGRA